MDRGRPGCPWRGCARDLPRSCGVSRTTTSSRERADHTLQSTALVNEAFLQLIGSQPGQLQNRAHFIAIASRLMRQILVHYARSRRASKREGDFGYRVEDLAELPVVGDEDWSLWTMRWRS